MIPDTSPCLFYKFLGYLYSGILDTGSLSLDELTEMLALSDKYEVCFDWFGSKIVFSLCFLSVLRFISYLVGEAVFGFLSAFISKFESKRDSS